MLEDDRQYFPPYDAVPVVHAPTLLRHPEIGRAIARLSGRVTAAAMRRMNYAVDAQRQDPAASSSRSFSTRSDAIGQSRVGRHGSTVGAMRRTRPSLAPPRCRPTRDSTRSLQSMIESCDQPH